MSNSGVLTKSSLEILKNEKAVHLSKEDVVQLRARKIASWKNPSEM